MVRQENLSTRFSNLFSGLKPDDDGVIRFKQMYANQSLIFEIGQTKLLGDYIEVKLDMAPELEAETVPEQPLLLQYEEQPDANYQFFNMNYMPKHFFNESQLLIPALIRQVQDRYDYIRGLEVLHV